MTPLTAKYMELLETEYIDKTSFAKVLEALAIIARIKAEHLSMQWQDEARGKEYDKLARAIERAARLASDSNI
jgi:hypothetical protein